MRRVQIFAATLVLSAGALTGCSIPTIAGGAGEDLDCAGGDVAISSGDGEYRVTGVCPRVHVDGSDLDVDLEAAEVGVLVVRGDGNEIEAADVAELQVAGQENDIEATSIDVVSIRGDSNTVDSAGTIGRVSVQGNDNDVEGQAVGEVVDRGQGNRISADD